MVDELYVHFLISFLVGVFGFYLGKAVPDDEFNRGFQCSQSAIVNGKAECVEYRKVEK